MAGKPPDAVFQSVRLRGCMWLSAPGKCFSLRCALAWISLLGIIRTPAWNRLQQYFRREKRSK